MFEQNRTFFPDAKGLSVSEQQQNSGQDRTSPAHTSEEGRRGTPAPHKQPVSPASSTERGPGVEVAGADGVVMPASYNPPAGKPFPQTPEEYAEEARELELLAQEAQKRGDSEAVRELGFLIAETLKRGLAAARQGGASAGSSQNAA